MSVNAYQVFVETEDQKAVEKSIAEYVKKVGPKGVLAVDDDESDVTMDERFYRTFILSPATNGKIAIWEDGFWADRLLAKHVSQNLHTTAYWTQMTSVTDTSAYCIYQNGKVTDRKLIDKGDPWKKINDFAIQHRLPYFLDVFENPYDDTDETDLRDMDKELAEFEKREILGDEFAKQHNYKTYMDMLVDGSSELNDKFNKLAAAKGLQEPGHKKNKEVKPTIPKLPKGYTCFYYKVAPSK
jgi:hypothetical protein